MRSIFNTEINSVRNEIEELKNSVVHMSKQYDDILRDYSQAKQRVKVNTEGNSRMTSVIKVMSVRINTLEQSTHFSNIE